MTFVCYLVFPYNNNNLLTIRQASTVKVSQHFKISLNTLCAIRTESLQPILRVSAFKNRFPLRALLINFFSVSVFGNILILAFSSHLSRFEAAVTPYTRNWYINIQSLKTDRINIYLPVWQCFSK